MAVIENYTGEFLDGKFEDLNTEQRQAIVSPNSAMGRGVPMVAVRDDGADLVYTNPDDWDDSARFTIDGLGHVVGGAA